MHITEGPHVEATVRSTAHMMILFNSIHLSMRKRETGQMNLRRRRKDHPEHQPQNTLLFAPCFGEVMAEKVTLMTAWSPPLPFRYFLFKHPHKSSMPMEEFLLKAMELLGVI